MTLEIAFRIQNSCFHLSQDVTALSTRHWTIYASFKIDTARGQPDLVATCYPWKLKPRSATSRCICSARVAATLAIPVELTTSCKLSVIRQASLARMNLQLLDEFIVRTSSCRNFHDSSAYDLILIRFEIQRIAQKVVDNANRIRSLTTELSYQQGMYSTNLHQHAGQVIRVLCLLGIEDAGSGLATRRNVHAQELTAVQSCHSNSIYQNATLKAVSVDDLAASVKK